MVVPQGRRAGLLPQQVRNPKLVLGQQHALGDAGRPLAKHFLGGLRTGGEVPLRVVRLGIAQLSHQPGLQVAAALAHELLRLPQRPALALVLVQIQGHRPRAAEHGVDVGAGDPLALLLAHACATCIPHLGAEFTLDSFYVPDNPGKMQALG